MQIDGWDVPIQASYHYGVSWSEFLRDQTPTKRGRRKIVDEHIATAELLSSDHGGLPGHEWLKKHGFYGLARCIAKHPELFAHVPRLPPIRKPIEYYISEAEDLAVKHNSLPGAGWLERNGYSTLSRRILKNFDRFAHISRQPPTRKTVDEHVKDAELLYARHGTLPTSKWLVDNGYNALYQCSLKNPDRFTHIVRAPSKLRTIEQHVEDAEILANEHGGLPRYTWLKNNGYSGLTQCIRTNPERFDHIPLQPSQKKTIEDHILDAELLAIEHGGLPNPHWLQRNGRNGLDFCIRKNPQLFAHIPRKSRSRNS